MNRDRSSIERPIRIGVFADVDTNLIDGSSIWLQSLVDMLHHGDRTQITLLLKATEKREVVTRRLKGLARVEIVDPSSFGIGQRALRPTDVGEILERLDQRGTFDAILIRGRDVFLNWELSRGDYGSTTCHHQAVALVLTMSSISSNSPTRASTSYVRPNTYGH